MKYGTILDYWFGDLRENDYFPARKAKIWYRKDKDVDDFVIENFKYIWSEIVNNNIIWETPRGTLTTIVVLDQFSRHIHRGKKEAFANDTKCLELCLKGIETQQDKHLFTVEKAFFYMPLQHSEDINVQQKSIIKFLELAETAHPKIQEQMFMFYEYALRHHNIIQKFGRFPHRNEVLDRVSSQEELKFLQKNIGF